MATVEAGADAPDPSWTTAELLARAEGCTSLSAAWLAPLAALVTEDLEPDARLTLALVLQRMVAVTDALALGALAAVPHRSCRLDPALRENHPEAAGRVCRGGTSCTHRWEVDELAALSGLPTWVMDRRRADAAKLTGDWAPIMPLLAGGRISAEHVRAFDRATANANPEATAAAVESFVGIVEGLPGPWAPASIGTVRRSAKRAVARHTTPAETVRKHRDAVVKETGVTFDAFGDGLAALTLTAETHKLEAIRTLIAEHPAVTRPDPDDTRTKGQRQVDLILALCLSGGAVGEPDAATGSTATAAEPAVGVIITASLETLMGLSNEPGLVGDSIVSAALIRQWAADPEWARRAVTDDHGLIRTISRKQRRPARRLRMAVQARWQRCTFPGCPQPARRSQVDHAHPFALDGTTELANLHPLCPRHHRLKEQQGVHVRLETDGTAVWTLPSGRVVSVPAPDHRVTPSRFDGAADSEWDDQPPEPSDHDLTGDDDYLAWVERQISLDPGVESGVSRSTQG